MAEIEIEHNLSDEELVKAFAGMAEAEGIDEQLVGALQKSAIKGCEPKQARDPYLNELSAEFHKLYRAAIEWIQVYVDDVLREKPRTFSLKKSRDYKKGPISREEIQIIQQAIRDRFGYMAAALESQDPGIDKATLDRWKALGLIDKKVTVADFVSMNEAGKLVKNAFVYGRMAMAVEKGHGFVEIFKLALNAPLTKPCEQALAVAEAQAAQSITRFGDSMAQAFVEAARKKVRGMVVGIHDQTLEALPLSEVSARGRSVETWEQFSSELYHRMEDKSRDWDRIAFYELNDSKRQGKAFGLIEKYGPDQLVFKSPMPTACPQCKALYLDNNEIPRLFRLADMLRHGSNVGKKPMPIKGGAVASFERFDGHPSYDPVAGLVHPYCECDGPNVFTGLEWWADRAAKP